MGFNEGVENWSKIFEDNLGEEASRGGRDRGIESAKDISRTAFTSDHTDRLVVGCMSDRVSGKGTGACKLSEKGVDFMHA